MYFYVQKTHPPKKNGPTNPPCQNPTRTVAVYRGVGALIVSSALALTASGSMSPASAFRFV